MQKIAKVAKTLNVGLNTIVETLHNHGIEVDSNPNTRITDEAYDILARTFSKDKEIKEKLDTISARKREEKKIAKEERKKVEEIPTVVPRAAGPTVVGKVDIDAKGNVKVAAKVESKPAAPVKTAVEPVRKEPVETAEPVVAMPEKVKEPVMPKPVVQPKAQEERVHKDTKPGKVEVREETVASVAPVSKDEKVAPDESKQDDGVFRLNPVAPAPQLKVVGTVNLDEIKDGSQRGKKKGDHRRGDKAKGSVAGNTASADKRKRKRINKEKIDIDRASKQPGFGDEQKKGGQQSGQNRNDRNKSKGNNKTPNKNVRAEVSSDDVQKQVKETLARLTNKVTKRSVKFRKEKREEMHNRELENAQRREAESRILKLTEFVTANDLAQMMDVPINNIIATCMNIGVMVSINQRLDAEIINILAEEYGFTTEYVSAEVSEAIHVEEDDEKDLVPRPPIVTVMGHVDHGKTSLLDYIRKANVIAGEAGGITQHIGAYNVELSDGRHITFLDTPGHEAFTAMRARGAKVTDLAIIIVAADDDVMPQTKEAINHASAAGVPIVFAINKIDKPTANPDKIKEQLGAMNYLVEDWGGKYQSQDISAKKGIGVEELMDKVLLEAELLDLKANPDRMAIGSVIESSLDKGRGYVATVLVQNGTLKVGDVILAGTHYGKIKAMFNERNQRVKEAGPATPVLVLGLNGAPTAGDTFNVMETEQEAREIANKREQLQRELGRRTKKRPTLEELGRRRALDDFHELNLVVKGDVDGSVEALSDSLIKLSTPEVQVNVLHKGVGAISESDVTLAAASDAVIIGFQVRPSGAARKEAEKEGVEIRLYSVIYKAIEEVKDAMEGMLAPEIKEEITGTAEVLQTYHISKVGTIAGAIVRDGKIKRSNKVRLIRDGIVIYTGDLGSLKRFKDDVKEVVSGYDCGLSIQGYNDIREGDLIEGYEEVAVKKTL